MTLSPLDPDSAVARYQELVRIPTVSRLLDEGTDWEPFREFRDTIARLYPRLHAALDLEIVRGHSMLFRWRGANDARPSVLMAHYDVVAATDEGWSHPPFGGEIVDIDGAPTIVGRGSIDDKASLVGTLEAVEARVADGFTPANDVYLAFSHNEEVLGDGTPAIVALLAERGIRPALVLDEGGIVGESIFAGVDRDVVYVGVSEKGTATVRITCSEPGGHASVPAVESATVRLARAIVEIDEGGSFPVLNDVTRRMIADVGPHGSAAFRRAAELLPTDEAAAIREFASVSRDANAMVHSIPLVTMIGAGQAQNAIAERASALVNIRVAAGDPWPDAVERLRGLISDPRVEFEVVEGHDAPPVSPSSGPVWDLIAKHIHATYGDHVIVVPYVNNGGTDSRNYAPVSDDVYRFSPYDMLLAERRSLHAIDERLRVSSFVDGAGFYLRLVGDL